MTTTEPRTTNGSTQVPNALTGALSKLDAVRDLLTVKRVYGDPYEAGGATIIPVAAVRGGGGAGGGGGVDDAGQGGTGAGTGFGVNARPVGVFAVQDGNVEWRPAVDVVRIALGGQIVAIVGILVFGRVLRKRRRRH